MMCHVKEGNLNYLLNIYSDVGLNSIDGVQVRIGDEFIPPSKVCIRIHIYI